MEQVKATGAATLQRARTLASIIPTKIRTAIYSILASMTLLELIWDVVPDPIEGKVLATLNVLGFSMAALNTGGDQS